MRGSFSIKLIEHIKETLEAGEQVIILRSRRAYSPALQCTSCGEIQKCPHCNVSLSLHRPQDTTPASGKVVCHHCGWSAPFRDNCIKCGSPLMLLGAGTQKIEEEAAILFPQARIARLDSDTAQNRTFEAETIRDFSNGKTDILIGTQIISKGFDFSKKTLRAGLILGIVFSFAQNFQQFLSVGGHIQSQLIQPGLVDEHLVHGVVVDGGGASGEVEHLALGGAVVVHNGLPAVLADQILDLIVPVVLFGDLPVGIVEVRSHIHDITVVAVYVAGTGSQVHIEQNIGQLLAAGDHGGQLGVAVSGVGV